MQSRHDRASMPAPPRSAVDAIATGRLVSLVFLPFALGYLLSYAFRTVNALIATNLTRELALTASDLGLLTSAYFLSFVVAQLPLGVLLDRFGPRRVQAALMLLAGCGSLLFAAASSSGTLTLGRSLIGFGVSGALMAGLKSIVQWFPPARLGTVNGCFIMFGGLGAYAAAGPSQLVIDIIDWRALFVLLAGLSALLSGIIYFVVPDHPFAQNQSSIRHVICGLGDVYRDRLFWKIAPASGCAIGAAWAIQGLWAARWLADVERFSQPEIVRHLAVMAVALCITSPLVGIAIDRLKTLGASPSMIMAAAFTMLYCHEALLLTRAALPTYIVWGAFGVFASGTVLSYTLLAEHYPKEYAGRAATALNLIHMGVAFGLQWGMGAIVDLWPTVAGHYPTAAYQAAFAVPFALQALSLCWMIIGGRPRPGVGPLPVGA